MRDVTRNWSPRCWRLVWVTAVWWVVIVVSAALVDWPGWDHPWWFELLRSPIMTATWAAWAIALVLKGLLAPRGTVWHLAYQAGREDAVVEMFEGGGKVVPLQRSQR